MTGHTDAIAMAARAKTLEDETGWPLQCRQYPHSASAAMRRAPNGTIAAITARPNDALNHVTRSMFPRP